MRLLQLVLLTLLVVPLFGVEEEIVLGAEDQWREIALMVNTRVVPGYLGQDDLLLSTDGPGPSVETELLLSFDRLPIFDSTGSYRVAESGDLQLRRNARFGDGAAYFGGAETGITLAPLSARLLAPGAMLSDFSIDFWLYPNVISDGQTVLSWEATLWEPTFRGGASGAGGRTEAVLVGSRDMESTPAGPVP